MLLSKPFLGLNRTKEILFRTRGRQFRTKEILFRTRGRQFRTKEVLFRTREIEFRTVASSAGGTCRWWCRTSLDTPASGSIFLQLFTNWAILVRLQSRCQSADSWKKTGASRTACSGGETLTARRFRILSEIAVAQSLPSAAIHKLQVFFNNVQRNIALASNGEDVPTGRWDMQLKFTVVSWITMCFLWKSIVCVVFTALCHVVVEKLSLCCSKFNLSCSK